VFPKLDFDFPLSDLNGVFPLKHLETVSFRIRTSILSKRKGIIIILLQIWKELSWKRRDQVHTQNLPSGIVILSSKIWQYAREITIMHTYLFLCIGKCKYLL